MKGLMQEVPLSIPMLVRHAGRLHGRKTVATRTADGVRVTSYAEVLLRARRLAAALRGLGVAPGDRVATYCWNHQPHLETYVAVPSMGSVLHTLNIRLFDSDVAYVVEHAQDGVVIVDKSLWPAWSKVAARVSCVRHTIVVDDAPGQKPPGTLDYEALLAGAQPAAEFADVPESEAAAMCYTSGTTGSPKGVVYSHRSSVLHSYAALMADGLGICEKDVVLPIVPMFHANAWGLPYACLMAGADLVMPGRFLTPDALLSLLVDRGVTWAGGVPTIWQALREPMRAARDKLRLRAILSGGSAVPLSLQQAYRAEIGVAITHAWGMTETSPIGSVCTSMAAHASGTPEQLAQVLNSQGRVAPGVEIRIVKEDGSEAPWDGESFGEIQVRGPWIVAAYYKDDSHEQFKDGWLCTGDVATIDALGYIRIVDRTKDVIKSGGEWISSVKLEGLIMAHPAVAEAAVVGVAHPRWDERPLACVVRKKGAGDALTKEQVLEHLAPQVPRFWLPEDVVFIDEVPKTSVGKFDKKVLRQRHQDHFTAARASA
jgi:fatty-acyl-CoA synthase